MNLKVKKTINRFSISVFYLILTIQDSFAVTANELVPRPGSNPNTVPGDSGQSPELQQVANLPEVSAEGAITVFIKTVLTWAFLICLVALVLGGIYLIKAGGDDEKIGKVKSMMTNLIIGMAIIAAAYGVVSGIAQFNFFGN